MSTEVILLLAGFVVVQSVIWFEIYRVKRELSMVGSQDEQGLFESHIRKPPKLTYLLAFLVFIPLAFLLLHYYLNSAGPSQRFPVDILLFSICFLFSVAECRSMIESSNDLVGYPLDEHKKQLFASMHYKRSISSLLCVFLPYLVYRISVL